MEYIFDCFERDKKASRELLAKYNTILPSALLDVWKEYGFGSLLDGYLKMINPDEYQALLHSSYVLSSTAIPIFITAFADILTWEKGRYIRIIKYKGCKGRFLLPSPGGRSFYPFGYVESLSSRFALAKGFIGLERKGTEKSLMQRPCFAGPLTLCK